MKVPRSVDALVDALRRTRPSTTAERVRERTLESSVLPKSAFSLSGNKRAFAGVGGPVICIAYPRKGKYSETFIRAHIERLPATVVELTRQQMRKSSLARFLRKKKVDAVLAEYGPTGVAVMEACNEVGIPLIVHFHGADAYRRRNLEGAGRFYTALFESSAALVVVSKDMERQLLSLGAPREKLHHNPCGVDISVFRGADPVSAPPVFLAVGRFVPKKAPHLTLIAFGKLCQTCPQAKLVMFGDGPLWETCQQLVKQLGIGSRVEFLGARPHSEVAAAMRRVRALVQHSIRAGDGDCEGTPVSVLEAGASGLPVVATRHGGIQDVVIHEQTGLLVEEADVHGMAACMERLVRDPGLAERLGRAARAHMASKYSVDASIDNLWTIITATLP